MDIDDKERFRANYQWFNQFFGDLRQLMEAISNRLVNEFALVTQNKLWYYGKLQYQPTIPSYYVTALSNKECVVQVYAILDTSLLGNQHAFGNELSFIIVKHSRVDRVLYVEDDGLRIIRNNQITQVQINEKVIAGEILAGNGKGTQYFAFQVLMDHFISGKDINNAIQNEIIQVLRDLPDWNKWLRNN